MANRIMAVFGAGQGPVIFTRELAKPIVEIKNGPPAIKIFLENEQGQFEFSGPGPHQVAPSFWMKIRVEGACKLPCFVSG